MKVFSEQLRNFWKLNFKMVVGNIVATDKATAHKWGQLPKQKARRFTRADPDHFRECRYRTDMSYTALVQWQNEAGMYMDPAAAYPQIINQVRASLPPTTAAYSGDHFDANIIYHMGYMTQRHLDRAIIDGAAYFDREVSIDYTGEFHEVTDGRLFSVYLGYIAYRNGRPYIRDNAECWGLKLVKDRVIFAKAVGIHERQLLPQNSISFPGIKDASLELAFEMVKSTMQAAFLQGRLESVAGLSVYNGQPLNPSAWYQLCFLEDRAIRHYAAAGEHTPRDGKLGGCYLRVMIANFEAIWNLNLVGQLDQCFSVFEPIAGQTIQYRRATDRYSASKTFRKEQLVFFKKLTE